jgi:hypothetical protein
VKPSARAWQEARLRAEQEHGLLTRELALLSETASFEARFQQAGRALLAEAPRLFGGADTVEVAAALANYVSSEASRHRVFVQANEPRGVEAAGEGVATFRAELRAVGDLEGILAWLHAMEMGDKLVRVDGIAIAPAARPGGIGTPGEEVLGVVLAVSGFALTPFYDTVSAETPAVERPRSGTSDLRGVQ